jgi:N-glycosylase/DNA lyase
MASWACLGTPRRELTLDNTLPTGQSFRWRKTSSSTYTGVIGQRVVQVRQLEDDVAYRVIARSQCARKDEDQAVIFDYFNLSTNLSALSDQWAAADPRFRSVCQYIPGARMLRQDPVECAFQFICSSNNHISRIHGMVERLCQTYGTPLVTAQPTTACKPPIPPAIQPGKKTQQNGSLAAVLRGPGSAAAGNVSSAAAASVSAAAAELPATPGPATQPFFPIQPTTPTPPPLNPSSNSSSSTFPLTPATPSLGSFEATEPEEDHSVLESLSFFAFPTLEQLAAATEADLRADGFGYRAKYITGSMQQLLAKPEGGAAWLRTLRKVSTH